MKFQFLVEIWNIWIIWFILLLFGKVNFYLCMLNKQQIHEPFFKKALLLTFNTLPISSFPNQRERERDSFVILPCFEIAHAPLWMNFPSDMSSVHCSRHHESCDERWNVTKWKMCQNKSFILVSMITEATFVHSFIHRIAMQPELNEADERTGHGNVNAEESAKNLGSSCVCMHIRGRLCMRIVYP